MALLRDDRWLLFRNIARPGEMEDWVYWQCSVPDTGQTPDEALQQLIAQDKPR